MSRCSIDPFNEGTVAVMMRARNVPTVAFNDDACVLEEHGGLVVREVAHALRVTHKDGSCTRNKRMDLELSPCASPRCSSKFSACVRVPTECPLAEQRLDVIRERFALWQERSPCCNVENTQLVMLTT